MSTTATLKDRKSFTTSVFCFDRSKGTFCEPWKSADGGVFSSAKGLGSALAEKSRLEKIGYSSDDITLLTASNTMGYNTIRAIHALRSGDHSIAFDPTEDLIYVEYASSTGNTELVSYDMKQNVLTGCVLSFDDEGTVVGATPMSFEHTGGRKFASSCVSLYMALLTAVILSVGKKHANEVAACVKTLLADCDDNDTKEGNIEKFFLLNQRMYKVISPNSLDTTECWIGATLGGLSSSGSIERLSHEMVLANSERYISVRSISGMPDEVSEALSLFNVVPLEASKMFFCADNETASTESKGMGSTGAEKYGKAYLASLRTELHLPLHPLSPEEQEMVPVMSEYYVVNDSILRAARLVKKNWNRPNYDLAPNIILEGDSGSGKTAGVQFLASMFGSPYTKMTMNATMDPSDLIGTMLPVVNEIDMAALSAEEQRAVDKIGFALTLDQRAQTGSGDVNLLMRKALEEDKVCQGLREVFGIPTEDECLLFPDIAWEDMGCKGELPSAADVAITAERLLRKKITHLINSLCNQSNASSPRQHFRYIYTELVKAVKFGYTIELQEVAAVRNPGVLTSLNSIMEKNGSLELVTGERIKRHPDTIIAMTANRNYAGNAQINESLRDRCVIGVWLDTPTPAELADRAVQAIGIDRSTALEAATAVTAVANEASIRGINGAYGWRSLETWCTLLADGDFSDESFKETIITKMTSQEDDVALLMECYRSNCKFASKTARSGRRV